MGKSVSRLFLGRRSETACVKRAGELQLTYDNNRRPWSPDELSVLDEFYPEIGPKVVEMLPGRTVNSCQKKAALRGLTYRPQRISKQRTARAWSPEELEILRTNYPQMRAKTYTLLPNRTSTACVKMAASLGIEAKDKRWSDKEDRILKQNYAKMGANVSALLPGRSRSACFSRAKTLKLNRVGIQWSAEEDAILKEYYPKEGAKAFQRVPHRSNEACQSRVSTLGISRAKAADCI